LITGGLVILVNITTAENLFIRKIRRMAEAFGVKSQYVIEDWIHDFKKGTASFEQIEYEIKDYARRLRGEVSNG